MGKSLIIKGADFSANGFHYEEVVQDVSTLRIKDNVVLTAENYSTLSDKANTLMAYENNAGSFIEATNLIAYTATAKADCEGWEKVRVKVRSNIYPQSTIAGVAALLFTDANNNVVGGITTMSSGSTSPSGKTSGVGIADTLRTFELAVPEGAKYVYSTYRGTSSITPFTEDYEFEMKLVKYELA